MSPHLLTNFKIQKFYQNEPKFNGVYSRNNLSKIKDGAYNKSWWVWINRNALDCFLCSVKNMTYFESLGVEHIPN